MKKIFGLISIGMIYTISLAQSPDMMSYQGVVRNSNGNLVSSTTVGMQISILQGSSTGTAVFVETHVPNTNANGLVSVEIGNGTAVSGSFSGIDWSDGPYFIKTETDPTGGTSYSIEGTTQLLSVPYAQYATNVENIEDDDADSTNELQALSISNDTIYLSNGGFVILPPEIDASVTNELQALSWSNDTIYLSNGNSIYIGNLRDNDWTENGNFVYNSVDSIGIGTSSPSAQLDVNGSFRFTDGNQGQGMILKSDSLGNAFWDTLKGPSTFETTNPQGISINWNNGDYALINYYITLSDSALVNVHFTGGMFASSGIAGTAGIVFPNESLFHNSGTKIYYQGYGAYIVGNGNWVPVSSSRSKILGPGTHLIRLEVASLSNSTNIIAITGVNLSGSIIPLN